MNTLLQKQWHWGLFVLLTSLFVLGVPAHAQEPITTPVATEQSQNVSLDANDNSAYCQAGASFNECISGVCNGTVSYNGKCITSFCGDYTFDDYTFDDQTPKDYTFDGCMDAICSEFYEGTACPVKDSCNGMSAVPCEAQMCADASLAVCGNIPLAVQTNDVAAVPHTSLVMLMMVIVLLPTSLVTYRK